MPTGCCICMLEVLGEKVCMLGAASIIPPAPTPRPTAPTAMPGDMAIGDGAAVAIGGGAAVGAAIGGGSMIARPLHLLHGIPLCIDVGRHGLSHVSKNPIPEHLGHTTELDVTRAVP